MTYHTEWWQHALSFVIFVLGLTGLTAVARGYGFLGGALPEGKRKAAQAFGAGATLGAVVLFLATSGIREPIGRPPPPPPKPVEVVTEKSFRTSIAPSLSLEAPDGWTISFDATARRLTVVDLSGATMLVVFSRQLEANGSPAGVRKELAEQLKASGVTPVEVDDTIGGKTALGVVALSPDGAIATWSVARGGPIVSAVQCRTTKDKDARTACKPVLDRIVWLAPVP